MTTRTQRAPTNGAADAQIDPSQMSTEEKLDTLIWLHAEMHVKTSLLAEQFAKVATTLAALLAQQMTPQVQQAILSQFLGP
jgi:hypothetical protein